MSADLAMATARLRYQATQLAQRIAPLTGDEVAALDAAQRRADAVLNLWGESASAPVPGERPSAYRRRLLSAIAARTPKHQGRDFAMLPAGILDPIEERVYADAAAWGNDPASVPPGQIRAVRERDESNRLVTRWVGSEYGAGFWDAFTAPGARGAINRSMADRAR
jgi:hypothetical protein